MSASERLICDAPCPYGGSSSARKYSRVELGALWRCNRPVKSHGDRCWQHREPVERPPRDCAYCGQEHDHGTPCPSVEPAGTEWDQ